MSAQASGRSFAEITVKELAHRIGDDPIALQLIDVREPFELDLASLPGFDNLPLSQFAEWSPTIQNFYDPAAETFVLCHHGMRSAQMCQWLVSQGFTQVHNIIGGIDAYSIQVDSSVPRY